MNKIFSKRLSGLYLMSVTLLISIPTVSACYNASGKQVSCSSSSCDPGFTSANGRQCPTPTPAVINPAPTPLPTLVIPIGDDDVNDSILFDDDRDCLGTPEMMEEFNEALEAFDPPEGYILHTEPPYYISCPHTGNPARQLDELFDNCSPVQHVQDAWGNSGDLLWYTNLPHELRWIENAAIAAAPVDPTLFAAFDRRLRSNGNWINFAPRKKVGRPG
ncbi:MAG: hypothetical protein ACI9PZ_000913 [Parvicella sp.]|jgi:hypothetical protein